MMSEREYRSNALAADARALGLSQGAIADFKQLPDDVLGTQSSPARQMGRPLPPTDVGCTR